MHLSVIIPAYNEEKHIASTIDSIYSYLFKRHIDHEIIVVTDGSKDKTDDIVNAKIASVPTLRLLKLPTNRGKGYAVRKGMLQATGNYRLFTDADNSTTIDHMEVMMPYFEKDYSVVIASIGVKGAKVAAGSEPFYRRLFGKMGNLFIRIMVVPGIHDTQRGFKILTAEAAQKIFSKMTIDRWGFDIELLALARKFGFKIKEVPISWNNDVTTSHVKLSAYLQVLLETVKIRWNLISGKYN